MKIKNILFFVGFCACFFPVLSYGQATVTPFVSPAVQFLDNSGAPLVGGKVCTFAAGTSTPLATYSDLGVTPNSNPVILDSGGRATIYLATASYKIVIAASTADNNCNPAIKTQDNVTYANISTTLTGLTVTGNVVINTATAAFFSFGLGQAVNENGPTTSFCSNAWNGSQSIADCWTWQDVLGTGTNPTSTLQLTHSGSSGTQSVSLGSGSLTAGAGTFSSVNGVINAAKSTGADIGAQINNSCASASGQTVWVPTSSAGSFATAISITNTCSVVFDQGTWTFTGTTQALSCTGNGITIRGSGNAGGQGAGSTAAGGTQIVVSNTGANGFDINNCPGIVVANLTLLGPNSGTGKGLIISANKGIFRDLVIKAFGSDGVNLNGTRANSNLVTLLNVTSVSNKGWGFNVFGANGNTISFIKTSGSTNTLGNYQIATSTNYFDAHSEGSVTAIGYAFISGGSNNTGSLYSESGNETTAATFASGANNNFLTLTSQSVFTNSGTGNTIRPNTGAKLFQSGGTSATPGYSFVASQTTGLWDVGNALGLAANATDVAMVASTRVEVGSGKLFCWGSAAGASGAGCDTGLSRDAAGVVDVGTGGAGSTAGSIKAAALVSGGSAAALTGTGACATITTQTGGALAGRATCTGTTGASTLTITPGTTAPNGWVCYVQDETTRANLFQQTATVAASCTLTVTSVTQNDVFVFTAIAF